MEEEGDGREEGAIYLYKVIEQQTIPREEVRSLWREGKVSGLFNLPTEELFNACRDFGVKVDISDLRKAKDETVVLRAKLKALIERSVDKERELFDLKTKVSELAQANLLQEGEFKKKLNELARNNKALVKERNKIAQEKNEMKEENQRLKADLDRLKQQLEEARAQERKREEQEQERRKREEEQQQREKEREVDNTVKGRGPPGLTRQPTGAESPVMDRSKLQMDLKRDRELLRQMAIENQRLTARVQQLMIENEEMKLSSSITQTDHLNRSLLLSFMNTMDSLNLVDDENETEADEWDEAAGDDAGDYYDDYGDAAEGDPPISGQRSQWITSSDSRPVDSEDHHSSRETDREYSDSGE